MTCKLVWCKKTENNARMEWYTEIFDTATELFARAEALFCTDNWYMMERHIWCGENHTYSREYNG